MSQELLLENDLAKNFEVYFKLQILFFTFALPFALNAKNMELVKMGFETHFMNLVFFMKEIKKCSKFAGFSCIQETIQRILTRHNQDSKKLTFAKVTEIVNENNIFLRKLIFEIFQNLQKETEQNMFQNMIKNSVDFTIGQFIELAIESLKLISQVEDPITYNSAKKSSNKESSRIHTASSVFCDEDDPYFILQPHTISKFLADKPANEKRLTLVLDLDETLVHFTENESNGKFLVRPFAREFLTKLDKYYELIIFTAALQDYADWILDRIDTQQCIKHRLYRDHTNFQNGVYLKDLSKINRDLSKTIIVDNNPDNFQMQPENGIYIKSWYEDPNDRALKKLAGLLIKIAENEQNDVRISLSDLNQKLMSTHHDLKK